MWDVILDALLDTLKLFPFLLLLYILIELMEHNTRMGRANRALAGKWAPLIGSATGLVPMCGFSVMAAKLYEKKYVTLGTLLAVFIATSDEAFLVMLVSEMSWLNKLVSILAMCGLKLLLGAGIGYAADLVSRRRTALVPMPETLSEHSCHGHAHAHDHGHEHDHAHDYEYGRACASEDICDADEHSCGHAEHDEAEACEITHMHDEESFGHAEHDEREDGGHHAQDEGSCGHTHAREGEENGEAHDEFTACEHKHGKWGNLSVYLVTPLLHSLQVAAFVLAVNLVFGFLFFFIGEDKVIAFLQEGGYWYQPLICSVLGFVPNCAASVILAEVYAMGGISFGSCLAGLIVNAGLGYLVLFRNVRAWKRTLLICAFMVVLGIAAGYAVNAVALALPPMSF